jgi:hypothetical protein
MRILLINVTNLIVALLLIDSGSKSCPAHFLAMLD